MQNTNYNFCKQILKMARNCLILSFLIYLVGFFAHEMDLRVAVDSVTDYAAYIQKSTDLFSTVVLVSRSMFVGACCLCFFALIEYICIKKNIVF